MKIPICPSSLSCLAANQVCPYQVILIPELFCLAAQPCPLPAILAQLLLLAIGLCLPSIEGVALEVLPPLALTRVHIGIAWAEYSAQLGLACQDHGDLLPLGF